MLEIMCPTMGTLQGTPIACQAYRQCAAWMNKDDLCRKVSDTDIPSDFPATSAGFRGLHLRPESVRDRLPLSWER